MTWIPGDKFSWPRPIRHILALLDDEVIEFDFHGIPVGRVTRGHPFHGKRKIKIENADIKEFESILEKELVILDFEKRKKMIRKLIDKEFKKESAVFTDKLGELLDEVANLVEYPDLIVGEFDKEFLSLPKEIIQAAMMEHQRYFPMERKDGTLISKFVTVSNRPHKKEKESKEEFAKIQASIRAGNERVIRARLADAKFFYDEDRKKKLEDYVPELAGMVYHAKLGSNLDKVNRLVELCGKIGQMLDYDEKTTEYAKRAAYLCRADLVTQMVGEFPPLQGVVGRIYAELDGLPPEIALSIEEHYCSPRSHRDEFSFPTEDSGDVLAIADRVDSLVAFFAIGEEPKGNHDPYALRRAAIELLVFLLNPSRFNVALAELIRQGADTLINTLEFNAANVIHKLLNFMHDRLAVYFTSGFPYDHVNAVLSRGMGYPLYFLIGKLNALTRLYENKKSGWFDLVKSVQRCRPGKIAKDLKEKGLDVNAPPEPEKFTEEGEHTLYNLFEKVKPRFIALTYEREYVEAGELFLREMKDPINDFFDNVFVNVEDEEIRLNRLRLTGAIYELFAENFADMAEIAGPEKTSER
jgi:glycyl-tRNA synthetase beta chain